MGGTSLPAYLARDGHVTVDLDALRRQADELVAAVADAADRLSRCDDMASLLDFGHQIDAFRSALYRAEEVATERLWRLEIWHRHNSPSYGGPTS